MPDGVEIGGIVVGRGRRVGGEVRVEGEPVGYLVEGHLKKEELCIHVCDTGQRN